MLLVAEHGRVHARAHLLCIMLQREVDLDGEPGAVETTDSATEGEFTDTNHDFLQVLLELGAGAGLSAEDVMGTQKY